MKIYLVGGAIRDKLLGLEVKERDWVVVGATPEEMLAQGFKQVGKDFPVFLHPATQEEYALARKERKLSLGYTGFSFDTSQFVSLEEDLQRRDLTINAMAQDENGKLIDPYGGKKDLEQRILRHVSSAFIEDPVRILRAGRFLARYAPLGFKVADVTKELMREMVKNGEVAALVAERVWKELERALGEKKPVAFFEVLVECGALSILFPGLDQKGTGLKSLAAASILTADKMVRFAALFHAYPEDRTESEVKFISFENKPHSIALKKICQRYRIPNQYTHLALLVHQYWNIALLPHFDAEMLITLFSKLDIYRRPERYEQFLLACDAIAEARNRDFNLQLLQQSALAAKKVNIPALIAQGLEGQTLAKQLKIEREKEVAAYLETMDKK